MKAYDARRIITFACTWLPVKMQSDPAVKLLMAIGWQESGFAYRRQINGPARGFWQFEKAGVEAVLKHHATSDYMVRAALAFSYPPTVEALHVAIEHNDILAAILARLLLWADPAPIPDLNFRPEAAWDYYVRNWRPGKPRKERWGKAIEYANDG